ncbi:hypothetical protein HYU18_04775 [Candidatus Woesearchaeota archaeon]|nr:hypothetical protein [Candidatus Woesearchaeota archaeon]
MKLLAGRKGFIGGMGMGGPRKPISLVMGLAFLAFGVLPILHSLGRIGFTISGIPQVVLHVLSIAGAVFLIWDAISEGMSFGGFPQMVRMATFGMAIALLAIGLVPLLNGMGVIGFALPAFATIVINSLYVVTGLLLIYGGTQGF